MRATILISTLAACAASPAMAQCVQVVCPPPVQVETHYQQPVYDEYVEVEEAAPRVAIHKPRPKARHHVAQKRKAVHHVQRKAAVRRAHPPRRVAHTAPVRPRHVVHYVQRAPYVDPIRDRAASYETPSYGQSTSLASVMSYSSSSYSSSYQQVRWQGPEQIIRQGQNSCGWGTRILTDRYGQAQRKSVWVCACPQGWRPPGE
ncbi:MAG: hypothetical protein RL186_1424 [Pseudomonadota bacterium]